ncbi:MAG TPA: DUF262 domain-containing protein [Candidatus Kapabacteria bacterium]|nr:DUF262 domain-containing protein [Candidatus Kapabacteria bacterium]HPO61901.1 DUF262 domain-containing protein [Candidatus Kapabacteria bacterium]
MEETKDKIDIDEQNKEIEQEDVGISKITNPYNPDQIKIDQQNVNLGFIIEMLENDEIDLMPDFQRSIDLWDNTKKSRLIESLLLGLPLPSFYFSVDDNNKWVVVDGLQRLCSFKDFIIDNKLVLTGLQFLDKYEGRTFSQLSREDIRKISGAKINCYVIEKQTPPNVKFLIFQRVNTGGLVLKPQEMRHALNQGIPANFIKELAELEDFKKATSNKITTKRMEDRDFTNRFVAFYLLGYEDNYNGELDRFLNDGMEKLKEISEQEREKVKTAFKNSMLLSFEIFGEDAFRKRFNLNDMRKPISKSIFDTISVNLAWLNDEQQEIILQQKELFKTELISLFNNDKAFLASITNATGQKSNVKTRFETIKKLLNKILNDKSI